MSAVRQVGIKMVVDAQSVTTETARAAREFVQMGAGAEQGAARTTRSLAQVSMSVRDIVQGAAGLHIVGKAIDAISNAITSLPREAFNFSKNLEASQVGMAGILGSMTAINGRQTDYNRALQISSQYIRQLNDDALRTAATSQELVTVFQALLAPGLGAKMTLDEIRQLTVVGTNAVKSMGLESTQVVQELRDLVAGGIQPASSTFATALGLKDTDIAKAKASSEGLFKFLMDRMQGFEASSNAFGDTFRGKLEQVREGATRVAAEGMEPLITASKTALGEISKLFLSIDENKNVTLNQDLIASIKAVSQAAVDGVSMLYEHRDAVAALAAVYASVKLGSFVAELAAATAVRMEAVQASRLAAAQAAAESAANVEVAATSRQKVAAYLAELQAQVAQAQADAAAQAAQIALLATTREAIVLARAEVLAKLDAVRATMAQAEAQIAAARAAGAQSIALALVREGTQALTAAQARHALLMTELATLGKQQASVQAAVAAATSAQTAATTAATASAARLAAAQGAASIAGRALSGAVGFLGGPIGIVTTALTLGATAWAVWGNKGSQAQQQVQSAVKRSTPEIIADLDKQIAKLQARNTLAAAGLGDVARQGGEAADRLSELLDQVHNLQNGKGPTGGPALPEAARVELMRQLLLQYGNLANRIKTAEEAQARLNGESGKLGLTVQGAEQAWRKANDGVKTAISIQQEYENKLSASRSAWEQYRTSLEQGGDPEKLRKAQEEQNQAEKQLAVERDKHIKELGAAAATARGHAIDAEIAATKQGYKLLAAQTTDSLAEVEAQRKLGAISDSDALQQRTALQLADIDAQRAALVAELALSRGRQESAKEQATLQGELAELVQKRANIEAQAAREQRELDTQAAAALDERVKGYEDAARAAAVNLRSAQLDTLEIGKTGEALGALRQERVKETAEALRRQALMWYGIDLSKRASKALREQADAVVNLAKVQSENRAAQMVYDYAKGIEDSNKLLQAELGLMGLSEQARETALEQLRIQIDLEEKINQVKADVADVDKRAAQIAQLKTSAAIAKANASSRAFLQQWKESVKQYDDVFRQGFADMLNRGEEGWQSFTRSLVTTFKTTVANELYKAFAQPFVVNIVGNLMGLFGGGGGVGQMLGGAGGGGSALGLASNASSAYNLFSGGLFGSSAAYGAAVPGLTMGGQQAAMLAAQTGDFGLAGLSATSSAGGGGLASGLAAAAPWIAGGLLLANGLGLFRTTEKRGDVLTGTLGEKGGVHSGDLMRKSGTLFGGPDWFVNDTGVSGADKAIQAQWSASVNAIKGWTEALGLSTDKISGFTATLGSEKLGDHGQLGLRIDGLSDQEVQAKIAAAIKSGSNELAQQIIGTWTTTTEEVKKTIEVTGSFWDNRVYKDVTETITHSTYAASEYAREGEQAIDTLQRLGTSIVNVNGAFETLNLALLDASLAGADAASRFVDLFGGLDQFNTAAATYYQNFYSDSERLAKSREAVDKQLKDLGVDIDLSAPDARAKFRAEVERQQAKMVQEEKNRAATGSALSTLASSGKGLSLADMSTSSILDTIGFDPHTSATLSQAQQDQLRSTFSALDAGKISADAAAVSINDLIAPLDGTGKSAEETVAGLLQASGAFAQVTESSQDAAAAITRAQDDAWAVLQKSVQAAKDAAQAEIDLRKERVSAARELLDLTREQARELRGQVDAVIVAQASEANAFIDRALLAARTTGYLPDRDELQRAITDARAGMGTSAYTSRKDWEAAQLILANKLDGIGDVGDKQLTTDELLLEQAQKEVDRLDAIIKAGREALDAARGTTVAVKDVETAVREFYARLFPEADGATSGTGGASGAGAGATWGPGGAGGSPGSSKYKTPLSYTGGTVYTGVSLEQEKRLDKYAAGYHAFDGTGDAAGLKQYIIDNKLTPEDMSGLSGLYRRDWDAWYKANDIPAFATGGSFPGGLRLVGEHGPELEATGASRIWNAQQTQALLSGGSSAEVVAAIKELKQQGYDIGRTLIVLLQSVEMLTRKQDAIGVLQRVPA